MNRSSSASQQIRSNTSSNQTHHSPEDKKQASDNGKPSQHVATRQYKELASLKWKYRDALPSPRTEWANIPIRKMEPASQNWTKAFTQKIVSKELLAESNIYYYIKKKYSHSEISVSSGHQTSPWRLYRFDVFSWHVATYWLLIDLQREEMRKWFGGVGCEQFFLAASSKNNI